MNMLILIVLYFVLANRRVAALLCNGPTREGQVVLYLVMLLNLLISSLVGEVGDVGELSLVRYLCFLAISTRA